MCCLCRAELLSRFVPRPSPAAPSFAGALLERFAARLLVFFVRHAALVRPLSQHGKLQLAKVCASSYVCALLVSPVSWFLLLQPFAARVLEFFVRHSAALVRPLSQHGKLQLARVRSVYPAPFLRRHCCSAAAAQLDCPARHLVCCVPSFQPFISQVSAAGSSLLVASAGQQIQPLQALRALHCMLRPMLSLETGPAQGSSEQCCSQSMTEQMRTEPGTGGRGCGPAHLAAAGDSLGPRTACCKR